MGCGDVGSWFRSLGWYGYLLVGIFIVIAGYFIYVHQAHLAAYSGIILIVLFIGVHFLACGRGHGSHGDQGGGCCGGGSHGNHGDHGKKEEEKAGAGTPSDTGKDEDEKEKGKEKGGSCH
ncbi:MAG TPA: hypothetical protein VKO45_08485 [Methanomicrobiales archaeon]|nr:hypothetical protein [Methanomicrobiales archaeon]